MLNPITRSPPSRLISNIALHFSIAIFAFLAAVNCAIQSQAHECDAILSDKLVDSSVITSERFAQNALQSYLCTSNFNEAKSSGKLDAAAKYKLFSGSISTSSDSFNQWKAESCGGSSSSERMQDFYLNSQRALKDSVVSAWQSCMARSSGLTCYPQPAGDEDKFVFILNWQPTAQAQAKISESSIIGGRNLSSPNIGAQVVEKGSVLMSGRRDIIVGRTPRQSVIATVSADYGGSVQSCSVVIPYVPPVKLSQETARPKKGPTGRWCREDLLSSVNDIAVLNLLLTAKSVEFTGEMSTGQKMGNLPSPPLVLRKRESIKMNEAEFAIRDTFEFPGLAPAAAGIWPKMREDFYRMPDDDHLSVFKQEITFMDGNKRTQELSFSFRRCD